MDFINRSAFESLTLPGAPAVMIDEDKMLFGIIYKIQWNIGLNEDIAIDIYCTADKSRPFKAEPGKTAVSGTAQLVPATPKLIEQCTNIRILRDQPQGANPLSSVCGTNPAYIQWSKNIRENDLIVTTNKRQSLQLDVVQRLDVKAGYVKIYTIQGVQALWKTTGCDGQWHDPDTGKGTTVLPATYVRIAAVCKAL